METKNEKIPPTDYKERVKGTLLQANLSLMESRGASKEALRSYQEGYLNGFEDAVVHYHYLTPMKEGVPAREA